MFTRVIKVDNSNQIDEDDIMDKILQALEKGKVSYVLNATIKACNNNIESDKAFEFKYSKT